MMPVGVLWVWGFFCLALFIFWIIFWSIFLVIFLIIFLIYFPFFFFLFFSLSSLLPTATPKDDLDVSVGQIGQAFSRARTLCCPACGTRRWSLSTALSNGVTRPPVMGACLPGAETTTAYCVLVNH